MEDKLRLISALMTSMNASFSLFVADSYMCNFEYPYVHIHEYNMTSLLTKFNYNSVLSQILIWSLTSTDAFTRASDILRLVLQYKYGMSYFDLDVHLLKPEKTLYYASYVSVAVYGQQKNSLELSNSAFCLPKLILQDLMDHQIHRILTGKSKYFYTELGPSRVMYFTKLAKY